MTRRSSVDGACCCTTSSFSRIMSRSGPRRPSGIVGTEGVASAGVGDEIEAYRVDMRFLILSSTRDLRTFLLGLDSLAAGFGPLRADEALLRRDCIVDVEREVFAARRADEDALLPSTTYAHVSPLSLISPSPRRQTPSTGKPHSR
jgi:hypothetical protein